jgi:hypothetical protein
MSKRMIGIFLLVITAYVFQHVVAKEATPQAASIDKEANDVLKSMGKCLANSKHFSFEAQKMMDFALDNGQMIQLTDTSEIVVSRPNKIKIRSYGDLSNEEGWYDINKLTMLDHENNTYGSVKVPNHIDKMMDFIVEEYGIVVPLADVLFSDPYASMTEMIRTGHYIGLNHVGKTKCHHLAFRQEGLDWQLWIDAGPEPLPRKLIITYKEIPGHPQFMAFFDRWNLKPEIASDLFTFKAPANAREIDMKAIINARSTSQPSGKPDGPENKK